MPKVEQLSDEPTPVVRHDPRCPACGGTGWLRVFFRHTTVRSAAGAMWKERTEIGEAEYLAWWEDPSHGLHWKQEMCYTAVTRCKA